MNLTISGLFIADSIRAFIAGSAEFNVATVLAVIILIKSGLTNAHAAITDT